MMLRMTLGVEVRRGIEGPTDLHRAALELSWGFLGHLWSNGAFAQGGWYKGPELHDLAFLHFISNISPWNSLGQFSSSL